MGRGRTNGPTIPDASSDWLFNKQTLGCLLHSPIGTVSPFASPASAATFPTPAPRPPRLLLRHAAPLLLLLFCAPDPPLLMLLLLCALALLLLPLLLLLFHMRRPAAPAPLPALPDDAARRRQRNEKHQALRGSPSTLPPANGCGAPAP
jgi:hypothetical protein